MQKIVLPDRASTLIAESSMTRQHDPIVENNYLNNLSVVP